MSELPTNWADIKLSEVAQVTSGIGFPTEYQGHTSGDLPFFKVSDISHAVLAHHGELKTANHYVSYSVAEKLKGKPITPGSTVFAKIGEAVRLNRRAKVAIPCLIDNNVMAVKAIAGIDDRYIHQFLRTVDFGESARSTTVPSLRKGDVEELRFPLAPMAEQRRIADKLDTVLARVDAVNERLARVAPILKRFRQSVLAAATSGRLTVDMRADDETTWMKLGGAKYQIPKSWAVSSLERHIDPLRPLCYGVVQPGAERTGGIPLVRVQDMEHGSISVAQLRTVEMDVDQEFSRSRVVTGDVLVSVVGTIGRVAVVPKAFRGNIARAIARVAPAAGVEGGWLRYWLESPEIQWWLTSSSREVARKTLNLGDLAQLPLPTPTREEQTEIVRRVETLFAFADRLEARLKTAQIAAERLTPSLLAKAFRGELVPQDPNDEPASALLKRLAATAPASAPKRGRRKAADAEA